MVADKVNPPVLVRTLMIASLVGALVSTSTLHAGADVVRPTIEIGLPDPGNMFGVLPLPADFRLFPDYRGRVVLRAIARDGGSGIRILGISFCNGTGSAFVSPSPYAMAAASCDTRYLANGAIKTARVTSTDYAGNRSDTSIQVQIMK